MVNVGTLLAALGCALIGGLMFAFSVSIMNALGRLPAAAGAEAMRHINVAILNPVFGLAFGGTTLLALVLAGATPFSWGDPGSEWRLAGGLLYTLGVFGVTVVINVPMNNRLAEIDPASSEGARYWAVYRSRWTAWNHLRTVAALAAAVAFMLGLP